MRIRQLSLALAAVAVAAVVCWAQDAPAPSDKPRNYSPYPGKTFPNRVYFGDTHLHTSYSTDAGMVGNTLGPEEAYRFARGEEVLQSHGLRAQLQRPLGFSRDLGSCREPRSRADDRRVEPGAAQDGVRPQSARPGQVRQGCRSVRRLDSADERPSGSPEGARADHAHDVAAHHRGRREIQRAGALHRLHRLRVDVDARAATTFTATSSFATARTRRTRSSRSRNYDTVDAEDLWKWMASYEQKTGGKVLAIPHNGNLSNGLMFDDVTLTTKKPLDRDYAERRMRWERLYEVTQMKGDRRDAPGAVAERRVRALRALGQGQLRHRGEDHGHAAARVRA